ncbi:MAG: class I SAM-dependent methyltransferase [Acidobacteria bacterium]|nr:class I SAM-dependent methyltransferase [Acidobacteriota bacterium]
MGSIQHKIAYRQDGRTPGPTNLIRRVALEAGQLLTRAGAYCLRYGLSTPESATLDTKAKDSKAELTYEDRVASEIARFNTELNVHDLPEIFHYWSNRFLRPMLEQVMEVSNPDEFYIKYIAKVSLDHPAQTLRVASLGAGNGDTEARIVKALLDRGISNFSLDCLDLNAIMLGRGEEAARQIGLSAHMRFQEVDLSKWHPAQPYAVVMANHVLHHIVPLEAVFDNVYKAIGKSGYFLTCDMIGRNGHMRWPEALAVVHDLWRAMPDRYKYNHQLSRYEEMYENWDCSQVGFEGIRAQDILPLLVKKFHFESFVGFGNLPDIFVERGFGHNFDPANAEDIAFIDRVANLNDQMIDAGTIKPTQMIAVMRATPGPAPHCYKHWTPEFCVRPPS